MDERGLQRVPSEVGGGQDRPAGFDGLQHWTRFGRGKAKHHHEHHHVRA